MGHVEQKQIEKVQMIYNGKKHEVMQDIQQNKAERF